MNKRYKLLIISLILNGFGNGLAIASTVGSVIWTASGQGLAEILHLRVGTALTIYGVVIIFLSSLLARKFDVKKMIGNFLFMIVFSYLVDFIATFLDQLGMDMLPFIARLGLNIVAVIFISVAISLYQRADVVLHPNDELMLVIRQKYTHNNATKAQMIAYIIPVLVTAVAYFMTGNLVGIGVGTLISFVAQGSLIDLADHIIFKKEPTKIEQSVA